MTTPNSEERKLTDVQKKILSDLIKEATDAERAARKAVAAYNNAIQLVTGGDPDAVVNLVRGTFTTGTPDA